MRLPYLALGWCVGILLATAAQHGRFAGLHLPLLWLALLVMLLFLAWKTRRIETWALAFLALGGLRMSAMPITSGIAAYNDLGGMTIEGIVVSEPDYRDDRVQLRVAAETVTRAGSTTPIDGLVLVYAPPLTNARYGDRVAATGLLFTPGESDRFSYADYLARSGVYSLMRESSVEVFQRATHTDLLTTLIDLRTRAAETIRQYLPEPQASLLVGILLGNERGIAPEVSDAFAATGAAHIVAISGFNMAILSGVVIGTLRNLRVRPIPAALISIAVIGIYTVFAGANPAVVRAALMSGLFVVGKALRRDAYLPASLAFAALLLSALNPLVLWDVGFQLSFFATLGLALFADPILNFILRGNGTSWNGNSAVRYAAVSHRLKTLILEPLAVTLAALVFTLPLAMPYFGQFSPVILLVNLLIIPVQTYLLLLGIAATLVALLIPPLAQILYWLDMLLLSWTIEVVRLFARVPTLEVFVSPNLVAVFFVAIVGVAMIKATQPRWSLRLGVWVRRRAVLSAAVFSCAGIVVLMLALFLSRPDGLLHVWLLDVGGGNAVLVQTPRGAHLLIDGGRFPSRLLTALGDRLPFTDRSLEVLVLTQPDEAQFGALPAVLQRYEPGVILSSGQLNLGDPFAALQAQISPYPQVHLLAGYSLATDDGVHIESLHPPQQPALSAPLDDSALVLLLTYGDTSILLMSDLAPEAQAELITSHPNLHAAVLQIPSRLDSALIDAVQPQIAVTLVEDPNPDQLAKLGDLPLYRTDAGGTIHLTSDGHSLTIAQER